MQPYPTLPYFSSSFEVKLLSTLLCFPEIQVSILLSSEVYPKLILMKCCPDSCLLVYLRSYPKSSLSILSHFISSELLSYLFITLRFEFIYFHFLRLQVTNYFHQSWMLFSVVHHEDLRCIFIPS